MSVTHLSNADTTDAFIQAHVLYHWLTYVNQLPLVDSLGAWSTVSSATDGSINSAAPKAFFSTSALFTAADAGKYIAVRDSENPRNSTISKIVTFVSSTELTLSNFTLFDANTASGVSYMLFDPTASPPAIGDFFVVQNSAASGPVWQARGKVSAGPVLQFDIGFSGGWDTVTSTFLLPSSTVHELPSSVAQTFCVMDSAAGYFYLWSDSTGAAVGDRNALWLGTLSPFHSPAETGVPKDSTYSAIFGSVSPAPPSNVSRDTATSSNFVVGEILDSANAVSPIYISQKRLLGSSADLMADPAASSNPRSAQTDDYDAVVFMRAPQQMWRGRVPGVRLLNDFIVNRGAANSLTYPLGGGIGSVWDGKVIF